MADTQQPPLNAAQVQAITQKIREEVTARITNMEMRKMAVQFALQGKPQDVVAEASAIYKFITEPVTEIVIRIEQ